MSSPKEELTRLIHEYVAYRKSPKYKETELERGYKQSSKIPFTKENYIYYIFEAAVETMYGDIWNELNGYEETKA